MSREIKFRAWNEEKKIMVDLQKITPLALNDMMNTQLNLQGRIGLFIPFFKELELMQYTGLKDRNNKEIYQGDKTKQGWIVVKESGCFWLTSHDSTFKVNYLYMLNKEIEIVGTIHDNKETK